MKVKAFVSTWLLILNHAQALTLKTPVTMITVKPAAIGETGMPKWRQGQVIGEWRIIANSALSSAPMAVKTYPGIGNEGPEAKVTSWNGFSLDTRDCSLYSVANGGHGAYAGNEVNRIKLSDDIPKWTEPSASTPSSQITNSTSHYADGRPTSRHTYYGTMIDEASNRALLIAGSRFGNGWMINTMDGFNILNNVWDPAKTYPDVTSNIGQIPGIAMVQNNKNGDIYAFTYFEVYRWTRATKSFKLQLSDDNLNGQYAASAFDSKRNRILLLGGEGNLKSIYNIESNTLNPATLTGPQASSAMGSEMGLVYDPNADAYFLRKAGAGSTVYKIDALTLNVENFPTTGGGSIPSTQNGVYRKFLYVPALKGIVYLSEYNTNLYFLRTN